jgi:prepilin-type N-terminal cleavage/methylation domain-containing protein
VTLPSHGAGQVRFSRSSDQARFSKENRTMQSKFVVRPRRGFSLVELSVVVIIIGVLAAFGVPRMLKSVERSKAAESFKYLASVRAAQERHQARQGTYASDLGELDMEQTAPKYFSVGTITAGDTGSLEDSWTLTLERQGASAGYGAYTVTFTEDGYDAANSTIEALPDINPQGN